MSAVLRDTYDAPTRPADARPPQGLQRLRVAGAIAALLDARRVLEARTGGTPVPRANRLVCRALEETGTITAFALWTGRGM